MSDDDRLGALLGEALDLVGDPRRGLPDPAFGFALKITPMINVDLLVTDEAGRILLAWREDEYAVGWHIPGGIIRVREPMSARIAAVANLEIGIEVEAEGAPCHMLEFTGSARGHFISLLFRCKVASRFRRADLFGDRNRPRHGQIAWFDGKPGQLYPAHEAYPEWVWTGASPDLAR